MKKTSDEDIMNLCEIKELDYIKRFVKNEQTYLTCVCNKHYKPVQFGGCSMEEAIQNFKRQQRHDKIKSDYCRNNGINLLSISYKEFDNLYKIIKKQCVK